MRVLIPVDGSEYSRQAIRFLGGYRVLEGGDPEIELLNVQNPTPPMHASYMIGARQLRDYRKQKVAVCRRLGMQVFKSLGPDIDASGWSFRKVIAMGDPGKTIAREADRFDADLIIMGSRGQTPVMNFFLGSVSNAVLALTRKPLLLVRRDSRPLGEHGRIGLAADGSRYSLAAAAFVCRHVREYSQKNEFRVIHVVPSLRSMLGLSDQQVREFSREDRQKVARSFDRQFDEAVAPIFEKLDSCGITASSVRLYGNPGEEIASYASKHLDLLVMGSHGHSNLGAAVIGSTAMKAAAACDLPILIVPG